jgi:type IV pilus biogenesis protein PilP
VASVPQRVTAKPVRAVAPQRAAAPEKPRRTTTRTGISRGNMALIGVFGSEGGRHALVRLPNGAIQRVRAGDSVQGVQVAAVGSDSVRLTGRGRDTLLKLPE